MDDYTNLSAAYVAACNEATEAAVEVFELLDQLAVANKRLKAARAEKRRLFDMRGRFVKPNDSLESDVPL